MFKVSYSIDIMDPNPTVKTFDTIDEAHDWIHQEVAARVDFAVSHSPYTMSECDIQDLETNEYALVSITDGVVTEFITK
tara:strand:- start:300 stop:536 length:237 start_codon:yes stop_codon:yes gene_type:complete